MFKDIIHFLDWIINTIYLLLFWFIFWYFIKYMEDKQKEIEFSIKEACKSWLLFSFIAFLSAWALEYFELTNSNEFTTEFAFKVWSMSMFLHYLVWYIIINPEDFLKYILKRFWIILKPNENKNEKHK